MTDKMISEAIGVEQKARNKEEKIEALGIVRIGKQKKIGTITGLGKMVMECCSDEFHVSYRAMNWDDDGKPSEWDVYIEKIVTCPVCKEDVPETDIWDAPEDHAGYGPCCTQCLEDSI